MGWLDRPLPAAPEFFQTEAIENICRIVGAEAEVDRSALADELRSIADCYWLAAVSSPMGIAHGPASATIDARKRKIASNVLSPAEKLIEALSHENLPLLSEWPEDLPSTPPNRQTLVDELARLTHRVRDLCVFLDDRKRKGSSSLSQEFKIDFADALTEVFEQFFPHARAARGGYDRTMTPSSEYQAFLKACSSEVFGEDFVLSGNVMDEVAKLRGNR